MEQAVGIFDKIFIVLQTEAGIVSLVLFLMWAATAGGLGYLLFRERSDHKETRDSLVAQLKDISKATTDAVITNTAQLAETTTLIKTLVQAAMQRS